MHGCLLKLYKNGQLGRGCIISCYDHGLECYLKVRHFKGADSRMIMYTYRIFSGSACLGWVVMVVVVVGRGVWGHFKQDYSRVIIMIIILK